MVWRDAIQVTLCVESAYNVPYRAGYAEGIRPVAGRCGALEREDPHNHLPSTGDNGIP